MTRIKTSIVIASFLCLVVAAFPALCQFQYISPKPYSRYHNPETNIILKNGNRIDKLSLDPALVTIQGSASGTHSATIILSDDEKSIVIYPSPRFTAGEEVQVSIADGFRTTTNELIKGVSFSFSIHPARTPADLKSIDDALNYSKSMDMGSENLFPSSSDIIRELCTIPPYTIFSSGNEFPGEVFYYNFKGSDSGCFARTILTNNGDSLFAMFNNEVGISFTINRNGYLTYYNYLDSCFDMMDTTYTVVKKLFMGNGYRPDEHELLIFPDGHYFMFSYDVQPNMDLTNIGGLDTVDVVGCVIQELDADGNVIFQWRSWDYMQFTDAVFWVENSLPNSTFFDWIHANSLEIDYDGNLLMSSRHLSEITKIDLSTGDMIWRMGGENNQFTFVNDPDSLIPFSGQHDFRLLPNGNYTMFNNCNNVAPGQSFPKEYLLDQQNKVATLVWSYKHPPVSGNELYSPALGNVQLLPNGNKFINWGLIPSSHPELPRFSEVDSAGNIVWEFNFDPIAYYIVYRAFKFDWNRCPPPQDSTFIVTYISSDSAVLSWNEPKYNSEYIFQYKEASSTTWLSISVTTSPVSLDNLLPNTLYDFRVQSICQAFGDSSAFSGIHQFTTLATSATDLNNVQSFTFFPNPAINDVTVNVIGSHGSNYTMRLFNELGMMIHQEQWESLVGSFTKVIDINEFSRGLYLMELNSGETSIRQTLIIQ